MPISDKRINERVSLINAAFTLLLLVLFVLTGSVFLILFLAFDFLLRSSSYSKFSVIDISSKNIVRYLPFDIHLINAGPKIFAARIGLVLSSFIILANYAELITTNFISSIIFSPFLILLADMANEMLIDYIRNELEKLDKPAAAPSKKLIHINTT